MNLSESENYDKIKNLLEEITVNLRDFFKYIWKQKFNKEWTNSMEDGNIFINDIGKSIYDNSNSKDQKNRLKKGNIENWDISALLLVFRETKFYREDNFDKNIKKLTWIRNENYHSTTKKVNNKDFNDYQRCINNILNYINNYYLNHKNAKDLKGKGNKYVGEKNYLEAINIYSKAIEISYLDDKDLAILFCNRAYCYFKQNSLDNALKDSESSINLYPDWYKSYFRKGQIYRAMKSFYKSKKILEKALSMNPNNNEIKKELNEVIEIGEKQKTFNSDDIPEIFNDIFSEFVNGDDIIKEKNVIIEINYNDKLILNNNGIIYGKDLTKKVGEGKTRLYLSKFWNINSILVNRKVKTSGFRIIADIPYLYDEDKDEYTQISITLGDEECTRILNYFNIKTGGNYLHLSEIYDIYINAYNDVCKFDIDENKVIFCKDNEYIIRDDNKIYIENKYYYLNFIMINDLNSPILVDEKIIKYIYDWNDINDNEKDIYEYINLIINKNIRLVEGNRIKIYKNNKRYDVDFKVYS